MQQVDGKKLKQVSIKNGNVFLKMKIHRHFLCRLSTTHKSYTASSIKAQ